jgi:pimeloyl-ACP methyl ester carboxylesterase
MEWRQSSFEFRGLKLAVQEYGPRDGLPVLALHGWQDNSASFQPLAPLLPGLRIIAPDFPGHGHSDWRHPQAAYSAWHYLEEVDALFRHYCPQGRLLLGHSMGGAIAALYAALYPERCSKLLLLDAVGPLATRPEDAPEQMREAFRQRAALQAERRRSYPDFEAAVQARAKRGLQLEAARLLAVRGVARAEDGWYWRHDPRLSLKTPLSFSEEQAKAFLQRIACPVLLVAARQFWVGNRDWFELRTSYFRQLELHEFDGGHHQHMEAATPQVAALIRQFLGS